MNYLHSVFSSKFVWLASILLGGTVTLAQAPNWLWAKRGGGNTFDVGQSVSTDVFGNVIVAGRFNSNTITFGTTVLTNTTTNFNSDIFIVKFDASGNLLWAKSAGGTSSDIARCVSTDASGNVLVTGAFYSPTITFDSFTLTNLGVFIVKYDASGNVIWARDAVGMGDAYGICADASNNVYITGVFGASINFGINTLTSAGISDVFVVKYDSSGNNIWSKSAGSTSTDVGYGITTDPSGNVLVTGYFESPNISFGTNILTNTGINCDDIFIVKYDTSGNVLWAKSGAGNSNDYGNSIATDASGNVFVTGYFASSTLTFGTNTLAGAGADDFFITGYDALGNVLWAKSAGGTANDRGNSVTTDVFGDILITGLYQSPSITFGTTTLANVGIGDVFVVKYNTGGNVIWATSAGGTALDVGYGISSGASGTVYVTGSFSSAPIAFGTTMLTSVGNHDIFIAKLDLLTNVTQEVEQLKLVVFPNPATNSLYFDLRSQDNQAPVEVEIFSGVGVQVYKSILLANGVQKIGIEHFADGAYFYLLRAGLGIIDSGKFIIVR